MVSPSFHLLLKIVADETALIECQLLKNIRLLDRKLFILVSDTKPEYVGCYSLDELQSQPIKASEVIHDNSPKHCGLWCRARGYTNFLLYDLAPHGITCRCANTLTFKKKRPESECDVTKCPGDLSKGCGSKQRTRVFQFKEEGIQSGKNSLCY